MPLPLIQRFWPLLLLALLLGGCAATSQRSNELLTVNYLSLADSDLQSYYRQLNDQIATEERSRRGGTSIGIGIFNSPVAVGVSQQVGSGATVAEDLRERRNQVRSEIDRRGLFP
ncbi:MAG: hypothetical protein ACYDAI_05505 [Trichloromonadaceae bacterium]